MFLFCKQFGTHTCFKASYDLPTADENSFLVLGLKRFHTGHAAVTVTRLTGPYFLAKLIDTFVMKGYNNCQMLRYSFCRRETSAKSFSIALIESDCGWQ